jgi:flagellar biosynthesis protein FlhA
MVWWEWIVRNRGAAVSVLIVALPLVLISPLPPWLMDFLLVLNITLSVLVLLTTLYVTDPLKFAVFPSLLLVTTLFRLVLNVGATRLILSNAERGDLAAGHVIRTFGNYVSGGHEVVGFIVFVILVVIQFVVITKGATRISEVAARFTLDGMPGKQMAIDADLNAGIITEAEARDRRRQIAREADFYGAMDGASKFVRGDAVAGLIITVVNLIGGLVIGILWHRMSVAEAASVFSRLTIGDGLVTQIPAFLISIASGLIVTRATAEDSLGQEMLDQLFNRPVTLWITSGFLVLLLFTPMPKGVVLSVAAGCGMIAYTLEKRIRTTNKEQREQEQRDRAKAPPRVETLLHIDAMEIEVGYGLIRLVDAQQNGDLLDRISLIRRQTALDLGVVVPPIRIRDNMQLEPNDYVIKIKGVRVAKGQVFPDQYLAMDMDSGAATGTIDGIETVEPAFGLKAYWVTATARQRAEALGYTVVDASSVLATHLTEMIKRNAHELLTRQEVNGLLDHLKERSPKLVEEVIPNLLKVGDVQKVLQHLLKEGVSIRNLEAIMETLGDYAARTRDPELLAEYVRHALARQICLQVQEEDGAIHAVALDPALEERLIKGIERTEVGSYLTLSPSVVRSIVESVSKGIERLVMAGHQPVILCAPQARIHLKRITENAGLHMTVLSYNEVVKEVKVETEGVVSVS